MKSTRQQAQRKLDAARNNLEAAGGQLATVAETYRQNHPDIAGNLDVCLELLLELDGLIEKIRHSF